MRRRLCRRGARQARRAWRRRKARQPRSQAAGRSRTRGSARTRSRRCRRSTRQSRSRRGGGGLAGVASTVRCRRTAIAHRPRGCARRAERASPRERVQPRAGIHSRSLETVPSRTGIASTPRRRGQSYCEESRLRQPVGGTPPSSIRREAGEDDSDQRAPPQRVAKNGASSDWPRCLPRTRPETNRRRHRNHAAVRHGDPSTARTRYPRPSRPSRPVEAPAPSQS